jgi:hypothetical protein
MYGDAIAALALTELCRHSSTAILRRAAARGLRFLEASQTPYAGWRYQPRSLESDTSVTAWALLALASGEKAGLAVNPMVWAGGRAWLSQVTEPATFRIGYNRPGRGSLGMSAAGLSMMLGTDEKPPSRIARAVAKLIRNHPPSWPKDGDTPNDANPPDFNYWFFGAVAARRTGGRTWRTWSTSLRKALLPHQSSRGHERGSFPPAGRWSRVGGRVYATATAAVLLAIAAEMPGSLE